MPIPKQPFEPDREGPLRGVRVLDFSRLVAGNMLSLQLADFGAEVVKVESPGTGDTLRDWREAGISVHWKVYARNKKSITLDLKSPEAPGIILDLAAHFDVLIESFRYRYLEKLGVGPDSCSRAIPSWSSCGSRDSGRRGPTPSARASARWSRPCRASPRATASTIASRSLPPLAMADMIAGLSGAMATVIAVRNVEVNGGRGQVIDVSLLESIFSILGPEAAIYKLSRKVRKRVGSASEGTSPRNVYATKRRRLGRHLRVHPGHDRAAVPRHRPRRSEPRTRTSRPTPSE